MHTALRNVLAKPHMPYVFNETHGLKKWREALRSLKAGENTIYNLNFCGDSMTEGATSDADPNNWRAYGYVGRLRTKLSSIIGDVGEGFVPAYAPHGGTRWVRNTGWSLAEIGIGPTQCCAAGASGTGTMTFSFTGPEIDVYFLRWPGGGTFSWKIDGGSAMNVNTASGGAEVWAAQIAGLSDAAHTLTLTRIADGATVYIFGALPKTTATRGIRVNNMARWGTGTAEHLSESYADFAQGFEISDWAPKLTVLGIVGIDAMAGLEIATYKSRMQTLISLAKASGDVLLLCNACAPVLAPDVLKPYADVLLGLAHLNNCCYINLLPPLRGPYLADADGLIHTDDTHWTMKGHYVAYKELERLLLA
jgi:hypothetical protein